MIIKQKPQKHPLQKGMICLIGIDGSGKTTHCQALLQYFKSADIKCTYVWFGVAYFFAFPFMIACRILGLTKISQTQGGFYVSEHTYFENKAISKIWSWVQFVDTFIFVNLRIKPLMWRGFTIVCDRFVPDIMVDLIADTRNYSLLRSQVGRLIFNLMPQPTQLVCMDVNEKTIQERKNDVLSKDYLSLKRELYHAVSGYLEIPLINAEKPFNTVQDNLFSILHIY